jgi:septum formation protein
VGLVLASASPRRRELLREAGIEFVVRPAHVVEKFEPGESPKACAERLARDKACVVAEACPEDWVLGADTVVAVGGELLGKPLDEADAARMLKLLCGREHEVITGVCLSGRKAGARSGPRGKGETGRYADVRSVVTRVTFSEMSDQEIAGYVASGEPMDKAGAYAIQGQAAGWIAKVEGDYSNVVGLPVDLVKTMLREYGLL